MHRKNQSSILIRGREKRVPLDVADTRTYTCYHRVALLLKTKQNIDPTVIDFFKGGESFRPNCLLTMHDICASFGTRGHLCPNKNECFYLSDNCTCNKD